MSRLSTNVREKHNFYYLCNIFYMYLFHLRIIIENSFVINSRRVLKVAAVLLLFETFYKFLGILIHNELWVNC